MHVKQKNTIDRSSKMASVMRFPPIRFGMLAFVVWVGGCDAPGAGMAANLEPPYENPVVIELNGMITPWLEQFLNRKLEVAQQRQSRIVILEIDSPGGFLATSLAIADRIKGIEWARVVAYVPREALSGAAIISLACDDIVLTADGRLGDAGAITMGEDAAFRYVPEKQRSVLVRQVRDLAEAKGRSPALAEAMVDKDLIVFRVRHEDGETISFMSDAELEAHDGEGRWEKLNPVHESREDHFLTVNGARAVELGLAAATAKNRGQLAEHYALEETPLVLQRTAVDTAVFVLNLPIITGVLLVVGLIALFIEFSAPGIGLGGLVSALCFALFFWSRFLGGTAGWLEVTLFSVGVLFLAMELFVIPGFGISGLAGLTLIGLSAVMASQHFVLPTTELERDAAVRSLTVVLCSGLAAVGGLVAASYYLGSIPVLGRLVLRAGEAGVVGKGGQMAGIGTQSTASVAVGEIGIADSTLRPAGRARFGDSLVDVVSDGSFVDSGQSVVVVDVQGNRVLVRVCEPPT